MIFVYKSWKRAVQMFFVCRRDYCFPFPKEGNCTFFCSPLIAKSNE